MIGGNLTSFFTYYEGILGNLDVLYFPSIVERNELLFFFVLNIWSILNSTVVLFTSSWKAQLS